MKIINILIIVVLALLSVAAGLAKVMQSPQEMEFLQNAGLSRTLILVYGLLQIGGGVLLAPKKTRMFGAVLVSLAYVISAVLIFAAGNLAFGLFSIIPIALAGVVIYQAARTTHDNSLNTDVDKSGVG